MAVEIVKPWVLINEAYFKAYSPIPNTFNIDDIEPYFKPAEKIWVEPVIGTPLYEELLEQVNTNTLTEENSTLLLVIYPYLAFSIVYEALPFLSYHITQVGLTKGKSDNSDSVSINDVNYINTHIRETVEMMKSQLKRFLNEHSDSFPLYHSDNCSCSTEAKCDCDWIIEYYGGGYKYHNWQYFFNKNKPNTRLQAFSTKRRNIDIR